MMMHNTFSGLPTRILAVTGILALLTACGGGGGGSSSQKVSLPPAPENLQLTAVQVKTLRFGWGDVEAETEYRLLENPDGASGFSEVAVIPADADSYEHVVPLYQRLDARYLLQACNSAGCSDSAELGVSGNLEGAIGYFKHEQPEVDDEYGYALALSADGRLLAVGIPGAGDNDTGRVAIYVRETAGWSRQALLAPGNGAPAGSFGRALSFAADGSRLALGVPYEGNVLVYAADGQGGWALEATLEAPVPDNFESFGLSVAMDEDGNTLAVGGRSGKAYIFTRSGSWSVQKTLSAGVAGDWFGSPVALSADGNTVAVTAYGDDGADDSISNAGAVYVFTRSSLGVWNEQATLRRPGAQADERFGSSLALSGDGLSLASAAINGLGITLFRQSGGQWIVEAALDRPGIIFGYSLAFSSDASLLVVGAMGEDGKSAGLGGDAGVQGLDDSGAAYLYRRNDGTWDQAPLYIKATNPGASDLFGNAVALSADGTTLAVSANREQGGDGNTEPGVGGNQNDDSVSRAGAVYLY